MLITRVVINLANLKLWGAKVDSQVSQQSQGDLTVVFKKWAVRYRSYVQQRFDKASKGDGTWRALSVNTVARRRKKSSTILRDTNTLFAALTPVWANPPGSINELIDGGVRVGFGGSAGHPDGLVTIAQIANFHQEGGPNLPQREIIVEPPQSVIDQCVDDLNKGLKKSTS